MKNVLGYDRIIAKKDIWEYIDKSEDFNDFVGKCVTHFVYFVALSREFYGIPERLRIDDKRVVVLTRKDDNSVVHIDWR